METILKLKDVVGVLGVGLGVGEGVVEAEEVAAGETDCLDAARTVGGVAAS